MVHALLDHCKCKVKYQSVSSKCFTVYLQWTRRRCITGLYHISRGAGTPSFRHQIFLMLCQFDRLGQLCFEGALTCGFTPRRGGASSYCSLSFFNKAQSNCPFAYTFWSLINFKAFHALSKCSKVIRNRCLP